MHGSPCPPSCADVSYVDGVTGGNVFLHARRGRAAARRGDDGRGAAPRPRRAELSELELCAVGEAMNQMMSSAALATSGVLGQEVEIAPPETTRGRDRGRGGRDAARLGGAARADRDFTVCGDVSARLVLLVPNAFVVRMDARAARRRRPSTTTTPRWARRCAPSRCACGPSSAARGCPPARRSDLPTGSVVELDREADDPIDLYVDGTAFRHRPPAGGRGRQPPARGRQVLGLQGARAELRGGRCPPRRAVRAEPCRRPSRQPRSVPS